MNLYIRIRTLNSFRAKIINVYTVLSIAPKTYTENTHYKDTHKSNRCVGIYFRTGDAELIALASPL